MLFYKKTIPENYILVVDKTEVFIRKEAKKLIMGSMISFKGRYAPGSKQPFDANFDYYYPNTSKNSLWKFLFNAFEPELLNQAVITKKEKEQFLIRYEIGITNLIAEAYCENGNSDDSKISITKLKEGVVEGLQKSQVEDIYFTSKNVKILFEHYLTVKEFSQEWVETNQEDTFILTIEEREFRVHIMPSPTHRAFIKGQTVEWKKERYKERFLNTDKVKAKRIKKGH